MLEKHYVSALHVQFNENQTVEPFKQITMNLTSEKRVTN